MGAVANHLGHCVTHLERSIRFYVEGLGFAEARRLTVPDGPAGALLGVEAPVGLTAVYLELGGFTLELLHFDRPANPPAATRVFNEPGLTHLSVSVDDLDGIVARLIELGATLATDLRPAAAVVRDPDGQLLELLPMAYRDSLAEPVVTIDLRRRSRRSAKSCQPAT